MEASINIFKKLIVVFAALIIVLTYLFHPTNFYDNPRARRAPENTSTNKTKYILYWTPFWALKDYEIGFGSVPFEHCEYKKCFATDNREMIPLEEYDALIFHASTYTKEAHGVPATRSPHQRYIFMNVEAPIYIAPDLKEYSSFFNWTMTYRFDSDIIRRHGDVVKGKTNYTVPSQDLLNNKTKLAAWFASNCDTLSKREYLTKEIQKFIPVDVYGSCGLLDCPRKPSDPKISSPACYDMVEQNYKFYFSFENSFCRDYSTEKLYNVLQKDVVPVVYGFGDYELSAPPYSVINVADFKSARDLAYYLKFLDEHQEEYLKYFEWKKTYRVIRPSQSVACQICEKLHKDVKRSIYYDLEKWWWYKTEPECKTGKDLPKIVSDLLTGIK